MTSSYLTVRTCGIIKKHLVIILLGLPSYLGSLMIIFTTATFNAAKDSQPGFGWLVII